MMQKRTDSDVPSDTGLKSAHDFKGEQGQPVKSLELPPVHPRCRFFTSRSLATYATKLREAGEIRALQQLGAVFHAVIFNPLRAWRNN